MSFTLGKIMKIEKDLVVTFSYILKDSAGTEVERSADDDPMAYLHGHGNILPDLELALVGSEIGDKLDVDLTAAQAYGERVEAEAMRVPIKHLTTKSRKFKVGQSVKVNTADGPRDATVTKVGKFNVDIDTNHPLAGIDLTFSIAILDVRAATTEEISHGHAHGLGGHHH
jgi:FKBP-type peptidyl-prolyl cis-trans isomerase SlyD